MTKGQKLSMLYLFAAICALAAYALLASYRFAMPTKCWSAVEQLSPPCRPGMTLQVGQSCSMVIELPTSAPGAAGSGI